MNDVALDINNLQGEYRTGAILDGGIIMTPVARLSYPALFERTAYKNPANGEESTPTFNCTLIFNGQNTDQPGLVDPFSVMGAHVKKTAEDHFAARQETIPFAFELNIHDGRKKEGKDGYGAGFWYISPKNYNKNSSQVACVDGQLQQLNASQIKGGDFVRARVRAYVSKTGKMAYSLMSVQKVLDWEGFGHAEDTGREWAPVPTATTAPIPGMDF